MASDNAPADSAANSSADSIDRVLFGIATCRLSSGLFHYLHFTIFMSSMEMRHISAIPIFDPGTSCHDARGISHAHVARR